jgi:hypothetical protein
MQASIAVGCVILGCALDEFAASLVFLLSVTYAPPAIVGLIVAARPRGCDDVGTLSAVVNACMAAVSAVSIAVYLGRWVAEGFAVPQMGFGTMMQHMLIFGLNFVLFGSAAGSAMRVANEAARSLNRSKADRQQATWLALANRQVVKDLRVKKIATGIRALQASKPSEEHVTADVDTVSDKS